MKKLILALFFFSAHVLATPVNVNTADAQTLSESLNGIGIKKAEAIVAYRAINGNFKSINDLANVKGIGEKTIEKNKTDILISGTAPVKEETTTKK